MTAAARRVVLVAIGAIAVLVYAARDSLTRTASGFADVAKADSMGPPPTNVMRIKTDLPSDLDESSALVMSALQPGILFTINDSGNDAELFAVDTAGNLRGRWKIDGKNRDWEAASLGPCTENAVVAPPSIPTTASNTSMAQPSAAGTSASSCIYIADVGDNSALRSLLTVYQLNEPVLSAGTTEGKLPARTLRFRYPDEAHDVEAMYVGPDGTSYFITKRALRDANRKLRPALVFAIAGGAWSSSDTVVAVLIDSLPIVPGSADKRQITDASLSRDYRYLAVRTYGQIFTFATDPVTGRIRNDVAPARCNIVQTEAKHGEGVTWMNSSRELILSNEGNDAPLHRITCPLP